MGDLGELLEQSVANHGHLCPGQVLGVRLAMLGCREVGIDDPQVIQGPDCVPEDRPVRH